MILPVHCVENYSWGLVLMNSAGLLRKRVPAKFPAGLLVLFCALYWGLFAEEVDINGNFQPVSAAVNEPKNWVINPYGQSRKELRERILFHCSEPDDSGFRTLTVKAPDKTKLFGIRGTLPVPVAAGDKLTFSGEAWGSGEIQVGYYGYGTIAKGTDVRLGKVALENARKRFTFTYVITDFTGDASARILPAVNFPPGGADAKIRNLRLSIEIGNPTVAARRGFRHYPIHRMEFPPTLVLEQGQEIWKKIPEGKGFIIHKVNQWQDESSQTSFRMAHDGKHLYVLIHCLEPSVENIRFSPEEIQKPLCSVEFAISAVRGAQGTPHGWYSVDTQGTIRNLYSERKNSRAVVRKGDGFWQAEITLDLNEILPGNEKIDFCKDYYFNIGRVDKAGNGICHTSFAASAFATPDKFAILSFTEQSPVSSEDAVLNSPYYRYLEESRAKLARKGLEGWQSDYESYGTTSGEKMARLLALSEQAAEASGWQASREILLQFQALDKQMRNPVCSLEMTIEHPEHVRSLYINGTPLPVPANGAVTFTIAQGANILAAEVVSGAQVRFAISGHPETLGRWRGSETAEDQNWRIVQYDDRHWQLVEAEEDGSFSSPPCIRQILFWEQTPYAEYRLSMPMRKLGFAQNNLEQMILFIDSPLSFPLENFTIRWDLPETVNICNSPAEKKYAAVTKTESPHPGYHRFVFEYRNGMANVTDHKIRKDQLIFQAGKEMAPGTEFAMFVSRSAGNFVELEQMLSCKILPEVNGKPAGNIRWMPAMYIPLPETLRYDFYTQLRKAGFNTFIDYQVSERFWKESGGLPQTFVLGSCFPMAGAGWGIKGALFEYVSKTPEAQALFFDSSIVWNGKAPAEYPRYMDHRDTTMFCYSHAVREGRIEFLRCIRTDVEQMLRACPVASILLNNWERHVGFGKMEFCFCLRCRTDFSERLGLSSGSVLTPDEIKSRFAAEWIQFQQELDGRMLGLTQEAVQGLGMQFMAYNGYANQGSWIGANGRMLFCAGCPGNGQVTAGNQRTLDQVARFFREQCSGTKTVMGQMILPNVGWGGGRFDYCTAPDGFFYPETLKNAIVRSAASLQGGARIDGSMQCGALYYIGEGTRLVAAYEPLFLRGNREDSLVVSDEIAYPDALVLTRKTDFAGKHSERLVLLFNDTVEAKTVDIENLQLGSQATGEIFEGGKVEKPSRMRVSIPPRDMTAIYIINPCQ